MYSILIVDDEKYMRNGIAKLLPWEKLGIDWVDTAESGAKALRKMEEHMPDIVLTDIEMNHMDGLELIRNVNRRNPDLRIIVLTGHDNFAYVQECCRMEVHDYYLKPIEPETLTEAIRKQVKELERISAERERKRTAARVDALENQIRVESAFHRFLKDGSGIREVRELLEEYGQRPGERLRLALVIPETLAQNEWTRHHELLGLSVNSLCIELVEYHHHGITFRDELGAYVLVLFCGGGHPDARELTEQLHTVLRTEYDMEQTVALSEVLAGAEELPGAYQEILRRRAAQSQPEESDEEECSGEQLFLRNIGYQQEIIDAMGDPEQALGIFGDWCELLTRQQVPLGRARQQMFQLLSGVYFAWSEDTGASTERGMDGVFSQLQQADRDSLRQVGSAFLEGLFASGQSKNGDVIQQVQQYINTHLDEPLSVTQLASQVYLSAPYFSRLFKKSTGVGCNYYIVQQRMEKAKQLLKSTPMKIGLVSEKVGYSDTKYFSLTFKKYAGCTPAEFRELA